ncbi:alpha/beta hydrolase family protein [Lentilactobacillus kosonis]|uniref:Esterase/lipase n=1 Tax=Lentilactobacillus kosonis TaxID=2810561 RepID=A0A401FNB2_9LACO|nr:alpha/beta hydrolase [Lentilactobacillus kosonis]GAY73827.1 esterase/lipase [Lentilactobacillus kosonis]
MTAIKSELDIVYNSDKDLKTDIYYDTDLKSYSGAIIDIHGGGWFRGDKSKDADWGERLAKEGYFVVVPNYRFTPAAYYPAPLEDMDNLYEWLKDSDYPFDHDHIGVVGSSAGGNMSVEMGIKYGIPIVSLSGILDIDDWLAKHQDVVPQPGDTNNTFNSTASAEINQTGANDAFYKWFVVNYFDGNEAEFEPATPYHRVTDKTGPMYLANSMNEFVPTTGVIQLEQTLIEHNIPVRTRFLTGSRHAKGYLDDVYDDTILFLRQTM